jgi:hypothetical protein
MKNLLRQLERKATFFEPETSPATSTAIEKASISGYGAPISRFAKKVEEFPTFDLLNPPRIAFGAAARRWRSVDNLYQSH